MKFTSPVTPAELTPTILQLCLEIVADMSRPFYINCFSKQEGAPQECFVDVENHVSQHGGAMIYGWALWEMPKLFIEAEFHAVWLSPEGEYQDIAFRDRPSKRILFLSDPTRTYSGQQVNNIRKPLSNNPILIDYLNTFNSEFDFMSRFPVGQGITLSPTESLFYESLMAQRFELFARISKIVAAVTPYSPCYCGSGKKVKWCCKRIG